MMRLPLFQVDAFSDRPFAGNPAAVCPLPHWLADETLQAIAAENNLSETAFFVPEQDGFRLRWFTPTMEVDLCGHATLATVHALRHELGDQRSQFIFYTRSGQLQVTFAGQQMVMDFPVQPPVARPLPEDLASLLPFAVTESYWSTDYLVQVDSAAQVKALALDLSGVSSMERGLIVTAPGEDPEVDFVSRWFGGQRVGVKEDPVTGSAHCVLTPYWAERLGKQQLRARQLSPRGGEIGCELRGERVLLRGGACTFMVGHIQLPDSV